MLRQFSNPEEVKKKAQKYGLNPIYESTRKNKKYMVWNGDKFIHFGAMGYSDFTKHHDQTRLKAIRSYLFSSIFIILLVMGLNIRAFYNLICNNSERF